jgi:hypothetical protein
MRRILRIAAAADGSGAMPYSGKDSVAFCGMSTSSAFGQPTYSCLTSPDENLVRPNAGSTFADMIRKYSVGVGPRSVAGSQAGPGYSRQHRPE